MKKLIVILIFSIGLLQSQEKASSTDQTLLQKFMQPREGIFNRYIRPYIAKAQLSFFQMFQKPFTTAVLPSFVQSSMQLNLIPIAKYDSDAKKLELLLIEKDKDSIGQDNPHLFVNDVITYRFSPQKKFLLAYTMGSRSTFRARILGTFFRKIVQQVKLIDTRTLKEIYSFDGEYITHEFSPNETSLIIATAQKGFGEKFGITKPSAIGASFSNKRQQSATGEILRYNFFDIASQSIVKTFENIELLAYQLENKLLVRYDDGTNTQVVINNTQSYSEKMLGIVKETTTNIIPARTIDYNYRDKTLAITTPGDNRRTLNNVFSYNISPDKKYLLANVDKRSGFTKTTELLSGAERPELQTFLINLNKLSDEPIAIASTVFTYEFSPDEKSFLVLAPITPTLPLASPGKTQYQLFDIISKKLTDPRLLKDAQSAFIATNNVLVSINNDNTIQQIPLSTKPRPNQDTEKSVTPESSIQAVLTRGLSAVLGSLGESTQKYKEQQERTEQEELAWLQAQKESAQQEASKPQQMTRKEIEEQQKRTEQEELAWLQAHKEAVQEQKPIAFDEELEQFEDVQILMDNFTQHKNKEHINKLILELEGKDDRTERTYLIDTFNAYDAATKKEFASLFFAPPAGHLNNSSRSVYSSESNNFIVIIVNERLSISTKANKNIFTSSELDNEIKTVTFNQTEDYLAVAYDSDTAVIDIFERDQNAFSQETKIRLGDFSTLIGLKFIETQDATYLFFIDKKYKMGYTVIKKKLPVEYKNQQNTTEQEEAVEQPKEPAILIQIPTQESQPKGKEEMFPTQKK